ncbi:MAG: peptidylprolyl isomerase [Anaerolineales bacterium]|nr:peptidylprolyl isomerase [Anaerolineales bacterium]
MEASAARQFFIDLADELGLDSTQFTQELDDGVYADYVAASEQEAAGLGLPGTPSAIVDGKLAAGDGLPRDFAPWDQYVSSAIMVKELEARQYNEAPPMNLEDGKRYTARVKMENGDEFLIELLPESAPETVNSFVFLAQEGWFDNVSFHRVIPGFVAQTGDPTGTGMGGPGYALPNEIDPDLTHAEKGMVAMANSGPDTNGSQWYVTLGDASFLDGGYTIFGRVIEGLDVVENITARDPSIDPQAPEGDKITTIIIEVE